MGIPRFLRRLRDAGQTPTQVIGRTSPATHRNASDSAVPKIVKKLAILDGPSLAHYIWNHVVKHVAVTDATIHASHSYEECGRATIAWLDDLNSLGFDVEAIFFDGALPESKLETRLERLASHVSNLSAYKTVHDATSRVARGRTSDMSNPWTNASVESVRKQVSIPPFLVPSITEALLSSTYASRTYVVPGEADSFCVAAALDSQRREADREKVIFTNDSDLVVFDAGRCTNIVMLNEIRIIKEEAGGEEVRCMTGVMLNAHNLARALDVSSLIDLAFIMNTHVQTSIRDASKLLATTEDLAENAHFDSFAHTYQVDGQQAFWSMLRCDSRQKRIDCALDARLSEIIFQMQCCDRNKITDEGIAMNAFLPLLIEDPSRACAWQVGSRTRQLSCSLLIRAFGLSGVHVKEFKRSGGGVSGTIMEGLVDGQILARLETITSVLSTGQILTADDWKMSIWQLMILDLVHLDVVLPTIPESISLLRGQTTNKWEMVHYAAQYAATFYSLRMLKQTLDYVLATGRLLAESCHDEPYSSTLHRMSENLKTMPPIAEVFNYGYETHAETEAKFSTTLEDFYDRVQRDHHPRGGQIEKKRKRNGKTRHAADRTKKVSETTSIHRLVHLTTNPFAALAGD